MIGNSLRWEVNAFVGFIERQKNLYRRYWAWEAVWLLYNLVSVLSIGYLASGLSSLGVEKSGANLQQAQLYLLIGALLWTYLSMVFFEVAFAITWERWEGTIEYTFMAPIKRITHLLGMCAASLLYGMVRAAIIGLSLILLFRLDLSNANWSTALVIFAASTLPLLGLGIFTSVLPLLSPEKGEQMAFAVQGVLLLISGVYYPITVLPLPLQLFGILSPLTYTLDGVRQALLDGLSLGQAVGDVGILLLMGVILVPASVWCFGRAERRAKRLGLLKRSG
ncbi:MAG TPA: ABC transporter permease [Candidatus Dormibacteraeota bacterium]|jgi:ABC-2 type transport system permease protein|nr:ABC transporter permease [Candidatus Dormibacteraeota bacterium]